MPGRHAPRSFSAANLIGVLCVLCVLGLFALPALQQASQRRSVAKCANNLRIIGIAMAQYADDYRFFPHVTGAEQVHSDQDVSTAYRTLLYFKYLDSAEVLVCPESDDVANKPSPAVKANLKRFRWGHPGGTPAEPKAPLFDKAQDPDVWKNPELSYTYLRRAQNASQAKKDMIIAADKAINEHPRLTDAFSGKHGNHADGFNILFADGQVYYTKSAEDTIMDRMDKRLICRLFEEPCHSCD
jgi:prepilin-type processing-associated H-X9-DG protein